jgi:integrase
MPTLKLNARTVESLRAVAGRRVDYLDTDVSGLSLRVTERGAKSWTVLYRHRGRLRRLTLGSVDAISLAQARTDARDVLYAASKGGDPAAAKRQARRAETIEDLTRDYIERHAKPHKRSWKEDDRRLRTHVLPAWKSRAIADVRRRDVRELVEAIATRTPVEANRVLACVRKMFSFAVDRELIEHNPAARFTRPGAERARDRVLTDDELRAFWQQCEALPPAMGAYFKLRLVTAQRGGEVSSMRWADLDLAGGWWTIPAGSSKNKLAHRVPLTRLALQLLTSLRSADVCTPAPGEAAADTPADYVLAGARGRRQRTEASATFTLANFRGHDLRRTAASLMAGGGVARLTIAKILNHVETGVTAVYDRHGYDAEKRVALDWWAAKLTAILAGDRGGKVLPFAHQAS